MINANKRWRIMANLFPTCMSGTPQILFSTYLSCKNSPIAANRRDIKLIIDMIHDPPELAAEMAETESWIKDAVSDPNTASMRV